LTLWFLKTFTQSFKGEFMSNELRVLSALKSKRRVTRKTAIENGWCENLTATISRLRQMGYKILTVKVIEPEGVYTRYRLAA